MRLRELFPQQIVQRAKVIRNKDGFPFDAWADTAAYEQWISEHTLSEEDLIAQRESMCGKEAPIFSIVVPLYLTPREYLDDMVGSVLGQTYGGFELLLVNASPESRSLRNAVSRWRKIDERVKEIQLEGNYGITENTNRGIERAQGDFVCFLDHDDYLAPNALYEMAIRAVNDAAIDAFYCDEDLVEHHGRRESSQPFFKPSYSPELLLSKNYVVHFLTVRKTLIDSMPPRTPSFDGAQDYRMTLLTFADARKVCHIPQVLYHWRVHKNSTTGSMEQKPYCDYSGRLCVSEYLERNGIEAYITETAIMRLNSLWFAKKNRGTISVVVDARSSSVNAEWFLAYFQQNNSYMDVELVLVGAKEEISLPSNVSVVQCSSDNMVACFAKGASVSRGNYLLFVSAESRFMTAQPLEQLQGLLSIDGVGVVGPKILYSNLAVRSFGVLRNAEGIMPLGRGYADSHPGYQCFMSCFSNVAAVGLDGMMVRRDVFERVGGLDCQFEGEIASVDLCERIRVLGLRVATTPAVKLKTGATMPEPRYVQGQDLDYSEEDLARFDNKWPGLRLAGDPYYNPNFDQRTSYCQMPNSVFVANNCASSK